jgi:hypothetical protein
MNIMKSIIVSLEEFLLFQNKIRKTQIDNFWEDIVNEIPDELKAEALKIGFMLIEDREHYDETFVRRFILETKDDGEFANEFKKLGEFYVYVR